MKQYIGLSRDHSISMTGIAKAAMQDYNQTVESIKNAANNNNVDTIVSVVECGVANSGGAFGKLYDPFVRANGGVVRRVNVNTNVNHLYPVTEYRCTGGSTPLLDSVGELIEIMEAVPDAFDPDVSFLIMTTSDGEENSSTRWSQRRLTEVIHKLTATDRWTFVFRCPRGYTRNFVKLGIPTGNILEWDQTEKGVERSTTITTSSFDTYYAARSMGETSTSKFYANLDVVPINKVKAELIDISSKVAKYLVYSYEDGILIRDKYELMFGKGSYVAGNCYYELTKTEKIQPNKKLIIYNVNTNAMYTGKNARDLLNIPDTHQITLSPGQLGGYKIFVQSTSFTRKLTKRTELLVYKA